ncbi:hypothetical protein [Jannaschia aquimarina]|uniref:Uncharacterized protein n=1 Tax=Jannaschia aquimarina TaxID=935700 RepID=A0A0D1ECF9_9RHOB|nr:hypothetical protein [Jannaschia aquimarina]KIT14611.1 hypothetical protein jaqu_36890 [Jannaschia aquimarina]SNS77489.1 hypothetical protein SAMN05421775_102240 [Jannaschia aquimarina]
MNRYHRTDLRNREPQTDMERLNHWLSGEVRVTRLVLVIGGVILLVAAGVALD